MKPDRWRGNRWKQLALVLAGLVGPAIAAPFAAQNEVATQPRPNSSAQSTDAYNQRLEQLRRTLGAAGLEDRASEYRIGPEDLLELSVFEAPELNRTLRVAANGEISFPLVGAVQAAGLTARELEIVLDELLRHSYVKDPHAGVFVREMQSHAVSVFGAVKKPGVYQIRGSKTLVEVLSMAEGLAEDAGDTVLVLRGEGFRNRAARAAASGTAGGAPPVGENTDLPPTLSTASATAGGEETLEISLKELLESGAPRSNVRVAPGDIVKVTRAGIVYVVGAVKKPGGFVLKSNENISVLQALALAEGLTHTSAKGKARIIRTDEATGKRSEVSLDLSKIFAGRAADPPLRPKDIVFVPDSVARGALYRGAEAALSIVGGVIVYRR